ncbi:TerD family protein [Streptomyces sp. 549]|uniref:TerD family protein n=1 Tax=Streptomyces sp. 549 TaxID=3049076 RepID=UPI0032E36669
MSKGGNVALTELKDDVASVVLTLSWSDPTGEGDADISVLLLGPDGKVSRDEDFYFYNNPTDENGSVQMLGKSPTGSGTEDRVLVDLGAVPAVAERLVVAASRYAGATFGALADLKLLLSDHTGETLLSFDITDASVETAFVFGELYRRSGVWKFRAVGQGYRSGLAGLATDFGIDVAQDETEEAEQDSGCETSDSPEGAATTGHETVVVPVQAQTPDEAVNPVPVPATAAAENSGVLAAGALAPDGEGTQPHAPGTVLLAPGPAVTVTADSVPTQVAAAPALAPPTATSKAARRPVRTAKRRSTLPRAPKVDLSDHPNWRAARLFSASGLRNDQERETRATSTLLAAMAHVPEFGRRLTAKFNAPAGTVQTFAEASFRHGDATLRPDGVIRVARAGRIWTALVETKTGGNPLKPDQVQRYVDLAGKHGYETVITLSNDLALDGEHPVPVDKRRLRKVALRHLSWAEVTHEAHLLCHHDGLANPAHAWLLNELLHYLRHDNAGCQGFQNMGASWVPVRTAITEGTLRATDRPAMHVAENWEKLTRQLCLRLGGSRGVTVAPVSRGRRGGDAATRRAETVAALVETGRLSTGLRIPGTPGTLLLEADLRTGRLETTVEVASAERARQLSRVQWLLRQLAEAPAEVRVEAVTGRPGAGPCELLRMLRQEPGLLVPDAGEEITSFRLTLPSTLGTRRGTEETGFIRSVNTAVDRFLDEVVSRLKPVTAVV